MKQQSRINYHIKSLRETIMTDDEPNVQEAFPSLEQAQ